MTSKERTQKYRQRRREAGLPARTKPEDTARLDVNISLEAKAALANLCSRSGESVRAIVERLLLSDSKIHKMFNTPDKILPVTPRVTNSVDLEKQILDYLATKPREPHTDIARIWFQSDYQKASLAIREFSAFEHTFYSKCVTKIGRKLQKIYGSMLSQWRNNQREKRDLEIVRMYRSCLIRHPVESD